MAAHVAGLRARGVVADAIDLPRRRAEDAVPALRAIVPAGPATVVGGQSYGGRRGADYAGLVLLSYPLHRPGEPAFEPRTAHWPSIRCPVLLLSGEADPFARIDLLRTAVGRFAQAELVTWPRLGHTLKPVLDDALDRVAAFVQKLG